MGFMVFVMPRRSARLVRGAAYGAYGVIGGRRSGALTCDNVPQVTTMVVCVLFMFQHRGLTDVIPQRYFC